VVGLVGGGFAHPHSYILLKGFIMSKLSKVFAGAAVASIGLSIAVYYNVDEMTGIFVGLWPLTLASFANLVK
jgi:hypothetical protein|tara:strand:- start:436 stop:651 length:216 start_codon:yes stop_codon:yes gene_type:complete